MKPPVVLDACALIAYLNDEEGADNVERLFQGEESVFMSAVNLFEVAYDAVRTSGNPSAARDILDAVRNLPMEVVWRLEEEVLIEASRLKVAHRISLADSIALGLANTRSGRLASTDHHEFAPVEAGNDADILWIR